MSEFELELKFEPKKNLIIFYKGNTYIIINLIIFFKKTSNTKISI